MSRRGRKGAWQRAWQGLWKGRWTGCAKGTRLQACGQEFVRRLLAEALEVILLERKLLCVAAGRAGWAVGGGREEGAGRAPTRLLLPRGKVGGQRVR